MLKSLELFGFKSFAERTVFEFAPGITCVVGPNGSGKSNVVDSIKWILGDQSPKSLRGKEMTDVIFNGSAGRKPGQVAEASLTFDNSEGVIPYSATEVRIGRRLYRSGDSEYLLNGNVVRLKDVRDLLLGTGAGTAAYSIIEQGRVDQILQSNPAARRQVFEEAAGISRFKSKRVDAERRLERVAQNLLRLTDIVDEIEAQLNATRSQASKAAKYRELSEELRVLWVGLAGDDSRRITAERTSLDETLAASREVAAGLDARLASFESARRDLETELTSSDASIRELEQQVAGLKQSIASGMATMHHHTQRGDELALEIEQVQGQQLALASEAALTDRELADARDRLAKLEESLSTRRAAFQQREAISSEVQGKLANAREDARQQRAARQAALEALEDFRRRLTTLQSQLDAAASGQQELEARREETAARLQLANDALAKSREQLEQADLESTSARQRLDSILHDRHSLSTELSQLELQLNHRREQKSTWQARRAVLQEWEETQRGVGASVRDLLLHAEQSDDAPWNSIRGIAGSLIDVPLTYAPVIDLVLGERAQAIVVDELRTWIDYWRQHSSSTSGRIIFVGLYDAVYVLSEEEEHLLRSRPGVIGRADEVVQEADAAPGLARRLLGDVWIVNDLTVAEDLLEISQGRIDCVTLQGELLHRDGRLTVGHATAENGAVSRRSELRQLMLDLKRLERTIDSETRRLAELSALHVARDSAVEQADAELRSRLEAAASVKALQDVRRKEQQRLANEVRGLDEQCEAARHRCENLLGQIEELRTQSTGVEETAAGLESTVASLEAEIEFVDNELRSLLTELDRERLELAKQEERLTALIEAHERFERDQALRSRQRQEGEARLRQLQEGISRSQLTVLAASAEVSELTRQVEVLQSSLQKLDEARAAVRGRRQEILRDEEVCRKKRHAAVDEIHQREMQLRELTQLQTTLETRMQEEYQLTLAEVEASGASAYADYLAGHGHAPETDETEDTEPGSSEPSPSTLAAGVPPTFLEIRPELESQVERLRRRIKALGHVNTEALNDLDELENRFSDLSSQLHDLQEAKTALEDIIRRINTESRKLFIETFTTIQGHFRELFRKLFGGGEAEIVLENPDDVLECGIDIVARPPGKELRSISLLSGGEKTLTAVALLFAMFKSKPSPYCILDEVDAALDEANVERYASIVKDFVSMTQFVIITHRKRTMTAADRLYGVTMEQAGISKRMSVRFEDVGEHGEILAAEQSKAA